MRVGLALLLLALAPGVAVAAPPANDAPGNAASFEEFTAANGTPEERQAVIDLAEATPDKGVPRCLGGSSFAKTVWFVVPAADVPRRVTVEASSPSLGTSEVPDLAMYVSAKPKNAQSCDGSATGDLATSAAAVEAIVPPGKQVLVQVGRSGGQLEQRVIASLRTSAATKVKRPRGDAAGRAPRLPVAKRKTVVLAGATLTGEDPAQPACPAAATVWRRTPIKRKGRYRVKVRGTDAGSLTVFVGRRPKAGNAVDCDNRRKPQSALTAVVKLARGAVLWTRIGVDDPDAGSRTKALVKPLRR